MEDALRLFMSVTLLACAALGQSASFEVATVKPSQRSVGPDYNNQFTYAPSAFAARNATLKGLIAEAYRLQRRQVMGPAWIDQNEYDIEARTNTAVSREEISAMLRTLLAERFNLKQHTEEREMRAYELVLAKSGPKLHPVRDDEVSKPGGSFHFHGDMRQFADLLAVQVSIPAAPDDPTKPAIAGGPPMPVLDKTGLAGTYDFSADIRPEAGTDGFTLWQRVLQEQLGLRVESRKGPVPVLVIDGASKVPTAN